MDVKSSLTYAILPRILPEVIILLKSWYSWNPVCNLDIIHLFFPFLITLGARVFARWTHGLFYRAFVTKATDSKVFINYDDGSTIWLNKNDQTSEILDSLPQPESVLPGQRVIGYRPNSVKFYPGTVINRSSTAYFVPYDDGNERHNKIYDIRKIWRLVCNNVLHAASRTVIPNYSKVHKVKKTQNNLNSYLLDKPMKIIMIKKLSNYKTRIIWSVQPAIDLLSRNNGSETINIYAKQ